jgi:hypothetical protein
MLDRNNSEFCFAFSFADPDWHRFPQKMHEKLGLVGNELWSNKSAKAGALVCSQSSKYPEIAVAKAGLDYLFAAVQRGDLSWGRSSFTEGTAKTAPSSK